MVFGENKTAVKITSERAFGGKWCKKSWKECGKLKDTDEKFYCYDYYAGHVNNYGFKCGRSLGFLEKKGCINKIDPNGCFQWYFRYWVEDRKMMKDKLINGEEL